MGECADVGGIRDPGTTLTGPYILFEQVNTLRAAFAGRTRAIQASGAVTDEVAVAAVGAIAAGVAQASAVPRAVLAAEEARGSAAGVLPQEETWVADRLVEARCAAHLAAGDAHVVAVGGRAATLVGRGHVCAEGVALCINARWLAQAAALARAGAAAGDTRREATAVGAQREAGIADWLIQARRAALLAARDTDVVAVWCGAAAFAGRGHVCAEGVALCVSARRLAQATALARAGAAAGDTCWRTAAVGAQREPGIADGLLITRSAALLAAGDAHIVAVGGRAAALVGWRYVCAELVAVTSDAGWLAQASTRCTTPPCQSEASSS